jgi:hypothetical protein
MPKFQYDDTEAIDKECYLTPVYFRKEVLVRYLYDSRFVCEFTSETYGTIRSAKFQIGFGINPNGSVVVWLGDLQETLPEREQLYWMVENKDPEGDPRSEFYDAEIQAKFTEPPVAVQCLNELAAVNAAFHRRFGAYLYHTISLEQRRDATGRYKRLVLRNIDDARLFFIDLNSIINENTNTADLRRILHGRGVELPETHKGNKLLEHAYKNLLGDTENLIAPFFYLYDLRLWASHTTGDKKRNAVAAALGVTDPADHRVLVAALLAAIRNSCGKLKAKIEA